MKKSILGVVVLGAVITVPAANAALVANLGYAIGGDTLAETDGADLDAGGGFYGDIGVLHHPDGSNISYQATIGLKIDTVDATNGDADTSSLPLNFLVFYNGDSNFRFGAGITYELAPEYSYNAFGSSDEIEFDDALGFTIEVDYFLNEKAFLGARYTSIDYDLPGGQALLSTGGAVVTSVDASNLGIHVGIIF